MQRICRTVLTLLALFVVQVAVQAAEHPLGAIPQDASVILRWQKPTETVKKAVTFAEAVDQESTGLLRPLSLGIGVAISNPEMTGVDQARDWYVAVFPQAEGEPGIVFAIPTTDAAAMQEAIQGEFTFATHDNWLLYSQEGTLIEKIKKQISSDDKAIDTRIGKDTLAVMDRNDLSIFLNATQLRVVYKEQFDAAEEQFDDQLNQIQNFAPPTPGIDLQPMIKMYSSMFRGMLRGMKDTDAVVIGLTVGKESIDLETTTNVTADSATDKVLQANPKSDMKRLARMPAGSHALFGISGNIGEMVSWGTKLSAAMYAGDEEGKKNLEKAADDISKLKFGTYAMSFGINTEGGGLMRVANVLEVKPTDKMRDLTRSLSRSMKEINVGGLKQEIELKADAEKYGDFSGDLVTTKQEIDPEQDPLGIQTQIQQILYGDEGQVQRVVYLQDAMAQTMGGGREAMESLLKSLNVTGETTGETKANTAATAVRGKLAPQANIVAMFDLPSLVVDALQAVITASQLPIPIDAESLKKSIGDERSFVGMSVAGAPQSVQVKLHVPLLQVKNMTKLVKEIRQMTQQPQF